MNKFVQLRGESFLSIGVFAFLTVLTLGLSGCGDSSGALNQKALVSLEQGNYGQAEELLKQAIQQDQANRTLRRNLVEVFFREQKWDEAIRLLKATLEIAGLESDLELRETMALAYVMEGEELIANGIIRDLLKEKPEDEYLLFLDGITAPAPQQAIKSLEQAVAIDPQREESYLALARAYAHAGETDKSRQALATLKEKFGNSSEVALYEVSLYLRENDTEMAKKTLEAIEEEFQDVPAARLFKAYLALSDRRTEDAQILFESLVGEDEVADRAKLGQALCLLTDGEVSLAVELCEEVTAEDPRNAVAYNLLGLGQLKRLQKFLAKENFQKSLQIDEDQPAIRALVDSI